MQRPMALTLVPLRRPAGHIPWELLTATSLPSTVSNARALTSVCCNWCGNCGSLLNTWYHYFCYNFIT